jgi:hypothetical protein
VLVAVWFFTTRDDATTSSPAAVAPGRPLRDNRMADRDARDLHRGNVILVVDRSQLAAARALASDIAGPPEPALRAAGQAVLVRTGDVTVAPAAVTAYAQGRTMTTATARDPALRAFVEYWLGRAAG